MISGPSLLTPSAACAQLVLISRYIQGFRPSKVRLASLRQISATRLHQSSKALPKRADIRRLQSRRTRRQLPPPLRRLGQMRKCRAWSRRWHQFLHHQSKSNVPQADHIPTGKRLQRAAPLTTLEPSMAAVTGSVTGIRTLF